MPTIYHLRPTFAVLSVAVKFVKACYYAVNYMTVCKRVEFSINNMTKAQQQDAKVVMIPMTAFHQHAELTG